MLLSVISLSAALLVPASPRSAAHTCTRGAFIQKAAFVGAALCVPTVAFADDTSSEDGSVVAPVVEIASEKDIVMQGVLQMPKEVSSRLPNNIKSAEVQIRVVGRNTKGPLATVDIPVVGKSFPLDYTVLRSDLREGVADFIWAEEDIYVKADLKTSDDKVFAVGRSKAKFVNEDGKPMHKIAYLTLE